VFEVIQEEGVPFQLIGKISALLPSELSRGIQGSGYCLFPLVIDKRLVLWFCLVVGVSRKKSYLDTVRQPKYWSGQMNKNMPL